MKIINIHCRSCGAPMRVVADSHPGRERICNLCIMAEVNGTPR